MDTLTDRERAILDLEQQWWATAGGKEAAITAMGMSPTRYYQLLNRLVATEKALAYAAVTVKRLHRVRSGKQHRRGCSRHILQP